MEIKLKTLTPLWTGGVDRKVDRVHETGILGSLRWWYEVLVRGVGGHACDPSKGECGFNADEYHKSKATNERQRLRDAGVCDVCQVFGATGWRRRFRLEVVDSFLVNAQIEHTIKADRKYKEKKGNDRTPTWYFRDPTQGTKTPNTPKSGEFTIKIQRLSPDFPPEVIAALFQFIADWTALGARAQMGFGVIEIVGDRINTQPLFDWIEVVSGANTYADLPSLRNVFLARISPKDGKRFSEQDTFNLKYDLRRLFASDKALRHFIMGTVKGERMAAKVMMSRPYVHAGNNTIRVWGWIPEKTDVYRNGWDREKVVNEIHGHLDRKYKLEVWREMNSVRDTKLPNSNDASGFLQSLLGLEE